MLRISISNRDMSNAKNFVPTQKLIFQREHPSLFFSFSLFTGGGGTTVGKEKKKFFFQT